MHKYDRVNQSHKVSKKSETDNVLNTQTWGVQRDRRRQQMNLVKEFM